jgi:hypothetical protein
MAHLCFEGTIEFEICTTVNSNDLKTFLKSVLDELNNRDDFDGAVGEINLDKVYLCKRNDCLESDKDNEEY